MQSEKTIDLTGKIVKESLDPEQITKLNNDFSEHYPRIHFSEHIGEGGFGHVFRGKADYEGKKDIAVKFMKKEILETGDEMDLKESKKRFKRECVLQEFLSQQYEDKIVKVYDYGDFKGHRFMVMELMRGESLREFINNHYFHPLNEKLNIMYSISETLSCIHDTGLIHRDVKPENMMFDSHGKKSNTKRKVKMTDLSLARVIESHSPYEESTVIGTAEYMSPEQVNEPNSVDKRTDIFSAGMVFYELINGKSPRNLDKRSQSYHHMLDEIANNPVMPAEPRNRNLEGFNDIFSKMMSHEPSKRYSSMDDVISELRDYSEKMYTLV